MCMFCSQVGIPVCAMDGSCSATFLQRLVSFIPHTLAVAGAVFASFKIFIKKKLRPSSKVNFNYMKKKK